MLLWLYYKETQRASNSYFPMTKECFLFTVHWIIPGCSQCGNHPHCPEIVSSAPASSLKNIYFTGSMLEYELTMTLWSWQCHCCQMFCNFTESGEVENNTLWRGSPVKNLTLFSDQSDSYLLAQFQFSSRQHTPQRVSRNAQVLPFNTQLQNCLLKEKDENIRKNHIISVPRVLQRFAQWTESKAHK